MVLAHGDHPCGFGYRLKLSESGSGPSSLAANAFGGCQKCKNRVPEKALQNCRGMLLRPSLSWAHVGSTFGTAGVAAVAGIAGAVDAAAPAGTAVAACGLLMLRWRVNMAQAICSDLWLGLGRWKGAVGKRPRLILKNGDSR